MQFLILILALLSGNAYAVSATNAVITTNEASVGATSVQVLAAKNRGYLLLQNKGTSAVYCKTQSAVTGTEGILLVANGGFWEPLVAPVDAIHCKSSDSTVNTVLAFEGSR